MARYVDDEYIAPAVPVRPVTEEVVVSHEATTVEDTGPNLPWLIGIVLAACAVILIAALAWWANDDDEVNQTNVVPGNNPSPTVFINPGTPYPAPVVPAPQAPPGDTTVNNETNNYYNTPPPAEASAS